MTNDLAIASTKANRQAVATLVVVLVSSHPTKSIKLFKLGRGIDNNNAYMKFGRNRETNKSVTLTLSSQPGVRMVLIKTLDLYLPSVQV